MKVYALLTLFLFTLGNCERCDNENWINRCKNAEGPMAMMKTGDCDFCNNTQRFCEGECLGVDFFTCWDRHVFKNPEPCDEASCEVVNGKRTGICTMGDIVPKLEDVKPEENENNGKGQGEEKTSDDGKEKMPDNDTEKPKENDETKTLENDDKSVLTNNPNKEVVKDDQQDDSEDISNVETPNEGSNNKEKPKKAPDTVTPTNNQSMVDNFTEPVDENSPDNGEENSPDNKEENSPDNGEENSPDNGEENTPDNGEENAPDNGEENIDWFSTATSVLIGILLGAVIMLVLFCAMKVYYVDPMNQMTERGKLESQSLVERSNREDVVEEQD